MHPEVSREQHNQIVIVNPSKVRTGVGPEGDCAGPARQHVRRSSLPVGSFFNALWQWPPLLLPRASFVVAAHRPALLHASAVTPPLRPASPCPPQLRMRPTLPRPATAGPAPASNSTVPAPTPERFMEEWKKWVAGWGGEEGCRAVRCWAVPGGSVAAGHALRGAGNHAHQNALVFSPSRCLVALATSGYDDCHWHAATQRVV